MSTDVTKDLLKALKIVTSQLVRVGDTRKHKDGEFIDLGLAAIAAAEAALAEDERSDLDCPVETGADDWVPWAATATSQCPVSQDTWVAVRLANGQKSKDQAGQFFWGALPAGSIVAYRRK